MLEKIIGDTLFGMSSYITDEGSTYLLARRYGPDRESRIEARNGMKREGSGKWLFKHALGDGIKMGVYGIALFGLDSLLGIEDNLLNFHHALFYGLGGMKHYAALAHTTFLAGFKKPGD